ncbi:retrovirus-related pol polyprotein from transposon TNT 1-94 [Tanacetum coccineum]
MKAEALKKQIIASRPIKALMVYPPNTPTKLNLRKPVRRELHQQGSLKGKGVLNKPRHVTSPRFTKMHDAHTVVQARCLELEIELSKLHDKVQKDDHAELVKRFSNLEVNHFNLQLKYQNLKERFGNNTSPSARDAPDCDSVFVIEKMKAPIQEKDNTIKKLRMQLSQVQETRCDADHTLAFRALDSQITQLTRKVIVLQEQNELFRAENEKIKQHYKELYDSIKITRAKHIEQITAMLTKNENLKVQIQNKMTCVTKDHVKPKVLAPGRYAIDVEPIPLRNRNNRKVHLDYLKHLKESVETLHEIVEEAKVVQIILWYLDLGCSKHMTGDRSRLMNFMKKFIGTVRFGNDHFGAIMGYGDYMIGDSVISRALMFLWAEVMATACYTQNRSLIHTHYNKTPYELVHNKKHDLTFFHVFGAMCYPTNDSEDLGKLQPTADIGIFVGYAPSRKGYRIYNKRT